MDADEGRARGSAVAINGTTAHAAGWHDGERARATLDAISAAVVSTDLAGNVAYMNPAAARLTGWATGAAEGRPFREVLRIADDSGRYSFGDYCLDFVIAQGEPIAAARSVLHSRNGVDLVIEYSATPISSPDGVVRGAVVLFREAGCARAAERERLYPAHRDYLTGLPHAGLLADRIGRAVELARRHDIAFAVLLMNLDRFKHVNSTHGEAVGDELLQSVAQRLETCIRLSDTASRTGGDEFVVLLPEITRPKDAALSAKKLLAAVSRSHPAAGGELAITASIGIGIYPLDGEDADALLGAAAAAMRQAKKHGRNRWWFARPEMNPRPVLLEFPRRRPRRM